jgi:4-hydroxy-4-methyl-2-oxoglutarate aldolase
VELRRSAGAQERRGAEEQTIKYVAGAKMRVRSLVKVVALAALVSTPLGAQAPAPAKPAAEAPPAEVRKALRAQRNTWTPVMDVLAASRTPVTDAQLARLKELPLEAVWGAMQNKQYRATFAGDFKLTQPGVKMVGRAVTLRYLPVRPDLMEAVQALGKEGDWDYQYNVRGTDDIRPGDVVLVELGGAVDRATFVGDVTGIAIQSAGARGIVVDGGIRDLNEFLALKDFPVYYKGAHASAMADHVGVEWNVPIRIGGITVLPGDVVIGDEEGVLAFPPQFADEVIAAAENTVHTENFKREMIRSKKFRTRDVYPRLSPELEKLFEEWKKTHPRAGVKPGN